MRPISLYSVAAVILPVALGLGLIYLYCVGRIDAMTAVAAIMALCGILVSAALLSRVAEDNRESHGPGWSSG